MADPQMTRELGVETSPCPKCGSQLKQTQLADGGVSTEFCTACAPAEVAEMVPEKASAKPMPREQGTTVTSLSNEEN